MKNMYVRCTYISNYTFTFVFIKIVFLGRDLQPQIYSGEASDHFVFKYYPNPDLDAEFMSVPGFARSHVSRFGAAGILDSRE